jgi:hypothetical protein
MKIKFLESCIVKRADGTTKRSYDKDKEYDVRDDTARHWIIRRKAVAVNGEISSPPKPPAPPSGLSDKTEERHNDKQRLKNVSTSADLGKKPADNSPNAAFSRGEDNQP